MNPTQAALADDPLWVVLLKAVLLFVVAVVFTLFNIWLERRVVARMQNRVGPNRWGPFGLLQSLADGVKLALKEDIVPKAADRGVYVISPILATIPAFLAFSVLPFGPTVRIPFTDEVTALQLIDPNVGVLVVLAITSVGVYGLVLAGWSSGSTYPLLGGLRSTAQVISYEIAMGLTFVSVFIYAGSMSTSEIVAAQAASPREFSLPFVDATLPAPSWFAVLLAPAFVIYVISMVGETNRAPFDLPEAEGELVGGFHTEYSSLKFALFFLAEYVNMVTVSALAVTLYLGGWRAPWPLSAIGDGMLNEGYWPVLWFIGKTFLFVFLFIWLRGTLPRLRYDQFMMLGWKLLIPLAIAWIVVVAALRVVTLEEVDILPVLGVVLAVVVVVFVASLLLPERTEGTEGTERTDEQPAAADAGGGAPFDPMAGGYPVPPLPGQQLPSLTPSVRTDREEQPHA